MLLIKPDGMLRVVLGHATVALAHECRTYRMLACIVRVRTRKYVINNVFLIFYLLALVSASFRASIPGKPVCW